MVCPLQKIDYGYALNPQPFVRGRKAFWARRIPQATTSTQDA